MGEIKNVFWSEILKGRDHLEHLGVGGFEDVDSM